METGIVDLVYIDPPFFSNRNYEPIWVDESEIRAFEDRFDGDKKPKASIIVANGFTSGIEIEQVLHRQVNPSYKIDTGDGQSEIPFKMREVD